MYTKENSGLLDDYITALAEDRQGNIWIGTRTKGVVVFDLNGQWITYQSNGSKNGLVEDWITAIFIDEQDQVWVGAERGGVSMLSPNGNWITYNVPKPALYDNQVQALTRDKKGRLWIGTGDGLYALEADGNWLAYDKVNSGLNPDWITALTIDKSNRLWIATFHEVIILDLGKPLPATVSNERIRLRTIMHIPVALLSAISMIGGLIFLPVAIKFFGFLYISLLILSVYSITRIRTGYRIKNQKLIYGSLTVLIFALAGAVFIWILSFVAAMMMD